MILGYGEDALTLWALKNRLHLITGDRPTPSTILYRPSFGRKVGYGEFDFIILGKGYVLLGESKWENSPELKSGLRDEQVARHRELSKIILQTPGVTLPSTNSILYGHIDTLIQRVHSECGTQPVVENILLVISNSVFTKQLPWDFQLVCIPPPTGDLIL